MVYQTRITERLIDYWERIRADKPLPSENAVDWIALTDVRQDCFLIDLERDPMEMSFVGDNIVDAYGKRLYTEARNHSLNKMQEAVVKQCKTVAKEKKPVIDESEVSIEDGKIIRYRQCLLPLSLDGENVNKVLGGMRYRTYKAS